MKRTKKINRMVASLAVIFALILQMLINPYITLDSHAAGSHSTSGCLSFSNTDIDSKETLKDNGDGTYTFRMELGADSSMGDMSENYASFKDGFFVVPYDGIYLIDLWGGDGADGDDTTAGEGGIGGSGAHLYGTVELKRGDVLCYTLGGHGQQTTVTDEGGGANGDGGGMGDIVTSSYQVGGGGGYSAVYLFPSSETGTGYDTFAPDYLDADGNLRAGGMLESDRISRYIMIAGGGGGGGAGDGFTVSGIFGGSSQVGRADGGNAGGYGSASGKITGTGVVNGTFYAGSDGKSSGTSTDYVGHGGSNVPGQVVSSITTIVSGVQPNDWFKTYSSDISGGGGGSGDMRGGAGGAGYCGGSGGVMTAIVEAKNVGGGGGGSSFVADSVSNVSDADKAAYEAAGYISQTNNAQTDGGGLVNITFLEASEDADIVDKIDIQLPALSKYFELVGDILVVDAAGTDIACIQNGDCYQIQNAVTIPTAAGNKITIEFTFRPVSGFAGGNDVPVFCQDEPVITATQVPGSDTASYTLENGVSYVNVPLNFKAIGKSYMTNTPGESYNVSDLYKDEYSDIRNNLSSDIHYDFIDTISTYTVTDSEGTSLSGTVAPSETTKYTVSFTVTPKPGSKATVGDRVENTTYSDKAVITVVESGTVPPGEDGKTTSYSKTLEYDAGSGQYVLSLNVQASVTGTVPAKPSETEILYPTTGNISIEKSGYYLIQAWGGNGGSGGSAGTNASGGAGGSGGYVYGYVHLDAGASIAVTTGANGTVGEHEINAGKESTGGKYSSVEINGTTMIIAGGGGGGGNGGNGNLLGVTSKTGENGNNVTNTVSVIGNLTDYDGGAGGLAQYSLIFGKRYSCTAGGAGGEAGNNFRDSSVGTDASSLETDAQNIFNDASSADYTNNGGGAVKITCLQLDETEDTVEAANAEKLSNYNLDANITKYFVNGIDPVSYIGIESENPPTVSRDENQNIFSVTGIKPVVTPVTVNNEDGTKTITSSVDFTVKIPLKPDEKLVGGNDIPLLESMNLGQTVGGEPSSIPIQEKEETDYANVDIQYTFDSDDLTASDVTIIKDSVSLYELKARLYSSVLKTDDTEGWIWDYAKASITVEPELNAVPTETTSYRITLDVSSRIESPEKAVVKGEITGAGKTLTATVYVNYSVKTKADSHLTIDNGVAITDTAYVGTLKADTGYKLPASIMVQTEGGDSVAHTYNPKTGEITISAETIATYKDNLVIIGDGVPNTYQLYATYKDLDGTTVMRGPQSFVAGTEVDPNNCGGLFDKPVCNPAEYEFVWSNTEVENAIKNNTTFTMPGNNLYVVGEFVPKPHTLTVNYVDEAGTAIAEPVVEEIRFGESYSAVASEISGYALKSVKVDENELSANVVVEGQMPAANRSITFVYKQLTGEIKVSYIYRDTNELIEEKIVPITANSPYEILSPPVEGYTPEKEKIQGTADAYATGMQYIVYYIPNQYRVTFDPDEGTLAEGENSKLVQYNQIYGYHAVAGSYDAGRYDGLPTPVKPGYNFLGWYTEDGVQITESTLVKITEDITLTAKWEAATYTIFIQFMDEDGAKVAESVSYDVQYDQSYDVPVYISNPDNGVTLPDLGTIYDHLLFSDNAAGQMPAQNIIVTVTYYFKSYTLTVNYHVIGPGGSTTHFWFQEEESVRYKKTYTISKSIDEAYAAHSDTWPSGVGSYTEYFPQQDIYSGTMPAENVTINYYYVTDTPVVSVTVEWGELLYDYTRGTWNPETHLYEGDTITEAHTDQNYAKVTNSSDSTIKVNVEFEYDCTDSDFSPLQPVFSLDGGVPQNAFVIRKDNLGKVAQNDSTTAVLDFSGQLWKNTNIPDTVPVDTPIPFGILKVTITGGEPK